MSMQRQRALQQSGKKLKNIPGNFRGAGFSEVLLTKEDSFDQGNRGLILA
jgi:hypothetical protein